MTVRIQARGVSLDVPMYVQPDRAVGGWASLLLGAAFDAPRRRYARILSDVSFDAEAGDRIAVLGRNGAGKSTLLRVLNGVYAPTAGSVSVSGSCQALLNISLGFNGEATVRENIFLRGTAMEIPAAQLREQMDAILDFAGLRHKASHRLRTLSSGQRIRLGFAISTSVQHDIMLMDEWLGAGDSRFMEKAQERMADRVGGSKIVMLASHSVGLLRDICNKGLVIESGRLVFAGSIMESLRRYHALMAEGSPDPAEAAEGLAGASTAPAPMAYGYVEHLSVEAGRVRLRGWVVDTEGRAPDSLTITMGMLRCTASRFMRVARPDVMRHLGLASPDCGFEADFALEGVDSPARLAADFAVFGGGPGRADAPLKLAGPVLAMLPPA